MRGNVQTLGHAQARIRLAHVLAIVPLEIVQTESPIAASELNSVRIVATRCATSSGTITHVTISGETIQTRRAGVGIDPIAGPPGA